MDVFFLGRPAGFSDVPDRVVPLGWLGVCGFLLVLALAAACLLAAALLPEGAFGWCAGMVAGLFLLWPEGRFLRATAPDNTLGNWGRRLLFVAIAVGGTYVVRHRGNAWIPGVIGGLTLVIAIAWDKANEMRHGIPASWAFVVLAVGLGAAYVASQRQ